jgi:hypothetical protein
MGLAASNRQKRQKHERFRAIAHELYCFEIAFAWFDNCRRLTRDYERKITPCESFIYLYRIRSLAIRCGKTYIQIASQNLGDFLLKIPAFLPSGFQATFQRHGYENKKTSPAHPQSEGNPISGGTEKPEFRIDFCR